MATIRTEEAVRYLVEDIPLIIKRAWATKDKPRMDGCSFQDLHDILTGHMIFSQVARSQVIRVAGKLGAIQWVGNKAIVPAAGGNER